MKYRGRVAKLILAVLWMTALGATGALGWVGYEFGIGR
jgi:hypothetical protein